MEGPPETDNDFFHVFVPSFVNHFPFSLRKRILLTRTFTFSTNIHFRFISSPPPHFFYYSKHRTFTPCPMDRVALAGGTLSMAARSSHSTTRTLTRTIPTMLPIQISALPPHGILALSTTSRIAFQNSTKSTSTRTTCLHSVRLSKMPPLAKPRQSLSLRLPTLSPSNKRPQNAPSTTDRPSATMDTAIPFFESR